jgi:polar amino acid transport system permease protein
MPALTTIAQQLLPGLLPTVGLSVASMAIALLAGVLLAGVARHRFVTMYVDVVRGTPLLLQLFLWSYGPTAIGFSFPPAAAGVIGLGAYFAAYISEILRGARESIPTGEIDAAESLGFSRIRIYRRVVLPQMIAIAIPSLVGQLTVLVKATSLLGVISVSELTLRGQVVVARTREPVITWIAVAVIYLILNQLIVLAGRMTERRVGRYRVRNREKTD